MKKHAYVISFVSLSAIFLITAAHAGNKKMVTDETKRLDAFNKEIVASQPDLPRNGKVYLSGNVRYQKGKPQFETSQKSAKVKDRGTTGNYERSQHPAGELANVVPKFDKSLNSSSFERLSDIMAIKVRLGGENASKGVVDGIVVDNAHFYVPGMNHSNSIKTCMLKEETIYVGEAKP